jgi:hypothetical protein
MCVFQPRIEKELTATVPKEDIYNWAEKVVKPAAELAWAGEGEQKHGDHCQFCRVKPKCRAWADFSREKAKRAFTDPPLLDTEEIAEIYADADEIIKWLNSLRDYALETALKGVKYEGFKVVEGTSQRRYTDKVAIAERLMNAGHRNIYKPAELLGLGDMEKSIGKKDFGDLLEGKLKNADGLPVYSQLVVKPPGKPTLVPDSDKRPEMWHVVDVFDVEE